MLKYKRADGTTVRELVLPEDLHGEETLRSLDRAPVTVEHPRMPRLDATNVDEHLAGDIAYVRPDPEGTYGEVAVRTARGLQHIQNIRAKRGVVGLSPVYDVPEYDPTPGVHPEYGPYDARQGRRIYNSLAVVENPRGMGAHLRLDSDDAFLDEETMPDDPRKDAPPDPNAKPAEGQGADPNAKPAEGQGADPNAKPTEGQGAPPDTSQEPPKPDADPSQGAPPDPLGGPITKADLMAFGERLVAEVRGLLMGHSDGMNKVIMDSMKPMMDSFSPMIDSMGGYVKRFDAMFAPRMDSADAPEVAYYRERRRLESIADRIGLPEAQRSADLRALKEAIVKTVRPASTLRADAADAYLDGVIDALDLNQRVSAPRVEEKPIPSMSEGYIDTVRKASSQK